MTTVAPGTKIIDILSKPTADGNPYVSLEYFPPRTDDGVKVCSQFTVLHDNDASLHDYDT